MKDRILAFDDFSNSLRIAQIARHDIDLAGYLRLEHA
jgi:hypothetical protein